MHAKERWRAWFHFRGHAHSPVAQRHEGEEYEDTANTGDQNDHHDDSVAVRLFDCSDTKEVSKEDFCIGRQKEAQRKWEKEKEFPVNRNLAEIQQIIDVAVSISSSSSYVVAGSSNEFWRFLKQNSIDEIIGKIWQQQQLVRSKFSSKHSTQVVTSWSWSCFSAFISKACFSLTSKRAWEV